MEPVLVKTDKQMSDVIVPAKVYALYDKYPVVSIQVIDGPKDEELRVTRRPGGFLRGLLNGSRTGEISHGRTVRDVPNKKIKDISPDYVFSYCSPVNLMDDIHMRIKKKTFDESDVSQMTPIEGITSWSQKNSSAYGMIMSLYEKDPITEKCTGDPVADSLAVVTLKNCGILALADGVSWGQKSKLASNCAIYGSISYLCANLGKCLCTKDVFRCILRSFERAQKCIVEEDGTMTTLCVGVVVPLQDKTRHAFCVVNVGDSYAYVYRKDKTVKEVTHGSHPIKEARDMRYSGGALGPADGYNPDLGNLTCSYVVLEEGDVVFLASDGISDNFDPVVAKFTPRFKAEQQTKTNNEIIRKNKTKKEDPPNFNTDADKGNKVANSTNEPLPPLSTVELHSPFECIEPLSKRDETGNTEHFPAPGFPHDIPTIDIKDTAKTVVADETRYTHDNKRLCDCAPSSKDLARNIRPDKLRKECSTDSASDSLNNSDSADVDIHLRLNGQMFSSHENLNDTRCSFNDHFECSSNEEDNALDEPKLKKSISQVDIEDKFVKNEARFHFPDSEFSSFSKSAFHSKTTVSHATSVEHENKEEDKDTEDLHARVASETVGDDRESKVDSTIVAANKSEKPESVAKENIFTAQPNSATNESIMYDDVNSSVYKYVVPKAKEMENKSAISDCLNTEPSSSFDKQKKKEMKSRSVENLLVANDENKDIFQRSISVPERKPSDLNEALIDLGKIAVQTLTPEERHLGALEQMAQIINCGAIEPITGSTILANDVCAKLMTFVGSRTQEKRDILEEVPQSVLNGYPSKERKLHYTKLKTRLEDVPGKLDHAAIVAYVVGIHNKEPLTVVQADKTETDFDTKNDQHPAPLADQRRQSEPISKIKQNADHESRKLIYAALY